MIKIDNLVSMFGPNVWSYSPSDFVISTSNYYLSLNTEFKFDSNMIGYEIQATASGQVNLQVDIKFVRILKIKAHIFFCFFKFFRSLN